MLAGAGLGGVPGLGDDVELGAYDVQLLLQLGDPDHGLGGPLLRLDEAILEALGRVAALALDGVGAARLWLSLRVASAARLWAAVSASSSWWTASSWRAARACMVSTKAAFSAVRTSVRRR